MPSSKSTPCHVSVCSRIHRGLSRAEPHYGAAMRTAVVILALSILALIAALLLVPRPARGNTLTIPRAQAAAVDGWERSWHVAVERADASKRPILALFTGSDWCPACIRLQREVLSTPAFRAWADARAVLLELDFPQRASVRHRGLSERAAALCPWERTGAHRRSRQRWERGLHRQARRDPRARPAIKKDDRAPRGRAVVAVITWPA